MSEELPSSSPPESHLWTDLTPAQVLDKLVPELYAPVSALGSDVDRLASGSFEDDDLPAMLDHIREHVNALSRLVVALKRYTKDIEKGAAPDESAQAEGTT